MTDSDQTLVHRAQAGDRQAFEQIVHRTSRLVFSAIYLDCGSSQQAEDLVQETFLLAWRSIGQLTSAAGLRAWLLKLGHSVTVDAARRRSRKKRFSFRVPLESADEVAEPAPGPAALAEEAEARSRALALLRTLPEQYRLPLVLRYLQDADYQTIGQQLGLSNGSLRGLLARGLARLREELEEEGTEARRHEGTE